MAVKTKKEYTMVHDEKIICIPVQYESPIDISQIPVFSIENCEILNSSITSPKPMFSHSVQILLPDNEFFQNDKNLRTFFTQQRQVANPNVENYKSQVKMITKKDILDGKFADVLEGRSVISIQISNINMKDGLTDETIQKATDATGDLINVKYYRVLDKYTGEGIEPKIFKTVNGQKTETFLSPKTKLETAHYVGKNDIVNIKLRPYEQQNQKTQEFSLKYNLLEIEIIQTAWDRGFKKAGTGTGKKVEQAPDAISLSGLSSMFGSVTQAPTASVDATPEKTVANVAPVQNVPAKTAAKQVSEEPSPASAEMPMLDFSALNNLSLGNANLGE